MHEPVLTKCDLCENTYESGNEYSEHLDKHHYGRPDSDTNPKDKLGAKKVNLFLVPASSKIYQALAMQDGAIKYGPYNWRDKKVQLSIYLSALERHIDAFKDGENNASDSGLPHLAHAIANIGIIIDALETGCLIDDRPIKGAAPKLIERYTKKDEKHI